MEKEKIVVVAEKVKSLAIALVGIVFFSWGTNYLSGEHLIYNVPRILLPVFNLFGSIGLAVGLLILGGGLIAYGFAKWKKVAANQLIYLFLVVGGLAAGVVLANVNFKSSGDIMKDFDEQREMQIDEIRNSDKPNFKNQSLEKYLADFTELYNRYEQVLQAKDEDAAIACENEFMEWCSKLGDFMPLLNNDEKYELSRYYAKLAISWNDLRQKYSTE
jgi:hypothetical protein